ncbi:MAG: hypothetical protein ACRCZC_07420, partial [Culicoidibacterales bacterium]
MTKPTKQAPKKRTNSTNSPKKSVSAKSTPRKHQSIAKKKSEAKRVAIKIPPYIVYEVVGVTCVLLAIITAFQLGFIGQQIFSGLVALVGVGIPVVILGLLSIGGIIIWQHTNFRWSWKYSSYLCLFIVALVAMSAIIQPNQT